MLRNLALLLLGLGVSTFAFRPLKTTRPLLLTATTTTQLWQHGSPKDEGEAYALSRRNVIQKTTFLAAAAALATTSGGPLPALAAGDISNQVLQIEKQFADSVNSNGAPEKHLPQVTVSKLPDQPNLNMVQVVVPHVMVDGENPHWIQAIWLKEESTGDVAVVKVFPATEPSPPTLKCGAPKGAKLTPYLYCNLHGLWKGDTFTV